MSEKMEKLDETTLQVRHPEWGKITRIILTEEETIFCKEFYCGEDAEIQDPIDIVRECISLMQSLMDRFEEWLEWQDIAVDSEEETFYTEFSYFEIVQRLLLFHTNHSGGNSTRELCEKLGFDSSKTVAFYDTRQEEGEEDYE